MGQRREGGAGGGVTPLPAAPKIDFTAFDLLQYIQIQKTNKKAPAGRQVQKGCRLQLHYLIHLYRL